MPFFCGWAWSKKRYTNGLVVHLSSAPLLWDGLILVQDVRGHVIQVLQSLASHLACHKVSQGVTGCHRERAKRAQLEIIPTYHPHSIHSFQDKWRWIVGKGMWRISWISSQVKLQREKLFKQHVPMLPLLSCCFIEIIFGQMSPPLMDGWTSEMSWSFP